METPLFFTAGLAQTPPSFFRTTPRLLSLDFDGTLAPIAPTPDAARMSRTLRGALERLGKLRSTHLAILSGRAMPDLQGKVQLKNVILVGNHGMVFDPPTLGWGKSALSRWTQSAKEAQQILQPLLKEWPGALLELKGPDLSLHYRRAHPDRTRHLLPLATELLKGLPLEPHHGKCVLEFRPRGAPGKGAALERLASRHLGKGGNTGVCVHIGDDTTDEDAFRALRRRKGLSLGLKVGAEPTGGHFRLRNTSEVLQFLNLFKDQESS